MSDLSEKEYKVATSKEDYPVLFGITYGNGKVKTAQGKRSDTHGRLFHGYDWVGIDGTWRYTYLTDTVYWWHRPSPRMKQDTIEYLTNLLGDAPKHHVCIAQSVDAARAFAITSHPRKNYKAFAPEFDEDTRLPSFQEWYKAHQGD
jgi:hypothetical protein